MSKQKQEEIATVIKLRAYYGLPQIRKGKRECLKCLRVFMSYDLCSQKTCGKCREERKSDRKT